MEKDYIDKLARLFVQKLQFIKIPFKIAYLPLNLYYDER